MCAFCAGEVARGEVVILASREDDGLLLAVFDFLAHEVPDILIPSFVPCLVAESDLVNCDVVRIHHTLASCGADVSKSLSPSQLSSSHWCSTVTVNGGVSAVRAFAIVVASSVLFGDFAR